MGSPIDPVTGLPMVGVPDVVSQIPLGKQVVPFSDMAATDRPQQGPAYPNDILNTLAWVTGEDVSAPGSMRAGTMTPDRRLRVDVAGGGGGGNATPVKINVDSHDYGLIADGSSSAVSFAAQCSRIYGMVCTWDVQTELTIPGSGWVDFCLEGTSAGNLMIYYRGSCSILASGAPHGQGESVYVPFNPPLDPNLMGWQNSGDIITMLINNFTGQQLDAAMLVYHD